MKNVERYDPEDCGGLYLALRADGDYVLYDDYKALLDEYNELLKATTPIRVSQDVFCKLLDKMEKSSPSAEALKQLAAEFNTVYKYT